MNDKTNLSDVFPEDAQEKPKRRRTIWIWLILAWSLYNFVSMAILYATYLLSEMPEIPGLDATYYFLALVSATFFIAGSLALFFFRAIAIKLFVIAPLVNCILFFYLIMDTEYLSSLQLVTSTLNISPLTYSISMWIIGLSFYMVIILYSLRLKRRGWFID